ncbi:capsular polysaccharide synthesis protein [Acinetobacter johnsonii]|uniref:capsular polysaccharide synthesis protein n=1 Tax=Acinetobacter johnsonii TaxID=40214 RepID=UPI003AF85BA4
MFKDLIHKLYFIWIGLFFRKSKFILNESKRSLVKNNGKFMTCIPKKIWIYWHDYHTPEIVNFCLKNIIKLHPDYNVFILNKQTVKEFIDIDVDKLNLIMPIANLSDLIRLKLLQKYGGTWLDASIILEENLNNFFLVDDVPYEVIGYYNAYQSIGCRIPVIESWLLSAPPNSQFINKWLEYFEPIMDLGADGLFDKFKKHEDFEELCKGLGDPKYLIVYIAAKLTYNDMLDKSNMLFYCCDDSAFSVQIHSKWVTRKCTSNLYIKDKFIFSPIYKLTSGDRRYYDFLKKCRLIRRSSIVGEFIERLKSD